MAVKSFRPVMTPANRLRAAVRQWVGYYLPRGRDLDIEQAYVRLAIASLVLCYSIFLTWKSGWSSDLLVAFLAVGGLALFAIAQIVLIGTSDDRRPFWRTAAIAADVTAGTIGMAVSGEAGVPMVGIYLWVTVGNGFRFGPRYLVTSYVMSLIGATTLVMFAPFWTEHRMIGVGLFLALAVVPLYVLILLSRLHAQRDSAEELSNAKSRFVANVSHELRTPLTGVYAVYDLLRHKALPPDERELVGMLGKSIGTLKVSVDAILQMSKLEAGAERMRARPFNLWYLLRQLASIVEPQATAKHLVFQVNIDADVPATVEGDPEHISHVLGNLLNNAFKFTHSGSVTLRSLVTSQDTVRFEVIDTGIGIPLHQQEHLFERFVQVDNSASRRYGGTGLGTSIAHDLVELMNGHIGVISAPGKGSTFWVELPLRMVRGSLAPDLISGQVVVIGPDGPARERAAQSLREVGVTTIECDPLTRPAANDPLAIAIMMDPAEAALYVESAIRFGWLSGVPWFTIASSYTSAQRSSLLRAGASEMLHDVADIRTYRATLAGFEYRITSADSLDTSAAPSTGVVRPLTILLADDNIGNRFLLSKILRDAGHAIVEASRGDEAFDRMAEGNVDLAMLDLNMPEMTGPDVVKMFRASEAGGTEKLPIIILSADATPAAKIESIESGANDFLTKPVSSQALLSAIERVRAGSIERASAIEESQNRPGRRQEALLDAERFASLRKISRGDHKFLEHYIGAAFEDLEVGITMLRSALADRDARAARDALHILEGTGASIGATALMCVCEHIRADLPQLGTRDFSADLAELATTQALTKSAALAAVSSPVV